MSGQFKCVIGFLFFWFVHSPYPIEEVLMFPASGVGLEADGRWQRKGFGKQWVSNRWKGAYASKSPQPANSPVTNCGKILASSRLGMGDHGEEWSVLRIKMVIWDRLVNRNSMWVWTLILFSLGMNRESTWTAGAFILSKTPFRKACSDLSFSNYVT